VFRATRSLRSFCEKPKLCQNISTRRSPTWVDSWRNRRTWRQTTCWDRGNTCC